MWTLKNHKYKIINHNVLLEKDVINYFSQNWGEKFYRLLFPALKVCQDKSLSHSATKVQEACKTSSES